MTWTTTPPTAEDCNDHEYFYRRLWMCIGKEEQEIVDIYRVLFAVNEEDGSIKAGVPVLAGPGETVAPEDIAESSFVEWQPVPAPEGVRQAMGSFVSENIEAFTDAVAEYQTD